MDIDKSESSRTKKENNKKIGKKKSFFRIKGSVDWGYVKEGDLLHLYTEWIISVALANSYLPFATPARSQ